MKLKPIQRRKGQNRYCGPAVISFIAGIDTDEAAHLIRHQTGKRAVRGTHTYQVRDALRALGYIMKTVRVQGKPTLAGWLRSTVEDRKPGKVFLVAAGNHWQLITGRRYACGIVGDIVSIKHEKVKRRARVTEVYEIQETHNAGQQTRATRAHLSQIKSQRKKAKSKASYRARKFAELAAKYDIGVDVERNGDDLCVYFDPPGWVWEMYEDGEVHFDSMVFSIEDAESALRDIVDIIEIHQ